MRVRFHSILVIVGLLFAGSSFSRIVPGLNLRTLVSQADLIVVGRVVEMKQAAGCSEQPTTEITAKSCPVLVQVERVLKGKHPEREVRFRTSHPDAAGRVGPVSVSRWGMFFLRKADDGKEIVDPYYPILPARTRDPRSAGEAIDRIVAELAQVLDAECPISEFRTTLYVLKNIRNDLLIDKLKRIGQSENAQGTLAMSELFSRGDTSLLLKAERLLREQPKTNDPEIYRILGESIAGIKDAKAVPVLSRLLRARAVTARRSAAIALGKTLSRRAVPALEKGLYDTDQEVRYNTVIALEKIDRQSHWAMSPEYFEKQEKALLDAWRHRIKIEKRQS